MNEDSIQLFRVILIGLAIGLAVSLPIILKRYRAKEAIIPKAKKFKSSKIFYLGVLFFSGFAAVSFYIGKPAFGSLFTLFALAYLVGLIAYSRGWRG
jgi:hypothetical protein